MAIIYEITNTINDKIYIGSSVSNLPLCTIHSNFKSMAKLKPNYQSYIEFNKIGLDNTKIELLENCNKEDVRIRKTYYIELYKKVCTNHDKEFPIKSNNKYDNAKIYKITNTIDDKFYIGSTTQLLSDRLSQHKCGSTNRRFKNKNRPSFEHFIEIGIDNLRIECLEHCKDIQTKRELTDREESYICQFIDDNNCLNSNHTIGTQKIYHRCVCGIPVMSMYKNRHINGDRHKDIMKKIEDEGEVFRCDCGIPLICILSKQKQGMNDHLESRSHKIAMELKEKGL